MKMTTPGEWIVSSENNEIKVVTLRKDRITPKTIAVFGLIDKNNPYYTSLTETQALANAALLAISKDMLDVLITIQVELNTAKETIDLEAINEMISSVFAKLANEAGEEL